MVCGASEKHSKSSLLIPIDCRNQAIQQLQCIRQEQRYVQQPLSVRYGYADFQPFNDTGVHIATTAQDGGLLNV
jgi:hypothetical protein